MNNNLIGKIFEKFIVTFTWKGNKKKIVKQTGEGLQILQEKQGVTNIFQIQNVTVNSIQELAGVDVPNDPSNLLKSAGQRFLAEQKTKQENLRKIVEKAELTIIENPKQVEQDWFLKWMEVSQTTSRENVQDILAKILKGEVENSETFSIRTLEILKNLNKKELVLFQKFCDISFHIPVVGNSLTCVISEPFGNPGSNGMLSLGLSYPSLTILQDAGLIQSDLNAWREYYPQILRLPFTLGSSPFTFKNTDETKEEKTRVKIINFTTSGLELRSVLNIQNNKEYENKFIEWVKNTFKMIPS